jgi:5'(3')-deoxyribonucleotidase
MRIVVDMDEVLADLAGEVINRWNKANGTSFEKDEVNAWKMENTLGVGVDGVPALTTIERWWSTPGFYESLIPIEGALDGVRRLFAVGHDIIIATSLPKNSDNAYDGKRRWLQHYLPEIPLKNMIAISRKDLLDGDIILDDAPHNIYDWCRAGKTGAFVMDRSWNQDIGETVHGIPVTRIYDWPHMVKETELYAMSRRKR